MSTTDQTITSALPPADRAGYVPELDAFRAVAILSVMCLHWLPAHRGLNAVQDPVSNGVHLFFTLSGFLITRILLGARAAVDDGRATVGWSLRQFYARRFLRIFPVYYLVLAVGAALDFPGLRAEAGWHAAYLSNVYFLSHPFVGPASVFWTLAVEEQFYLVWPFVVLLLPRRALVPAIAVAAAAGAAFRGYCLLGPDAYKILMPAAAPFLAGGALVAIVDHPRYGSPAMARWTRVAFAVLAAAMLCVNGVTVARVGLRSAGAAPAVHAANQTLMAMMYAVLFARTARGGLPPAVAAALRWPPVVYVGRISYGLYVWHLFVADGYVRLGHAAVLGPHVRSLVLRSSYWFPVKFALTLAVATASWFAFERPINDLKRLFPYARKPGSDVHRLGQPGGTGEPGVGQVV